MRPGWAAKTPRARRRGAAWFIAAGLWIAAGYVGLNSHMLQLGAAHHDAFCTEH